MIVYGSGLYGKTDEVPGLFYVATTFGHVWFIPLFPTRSHLVLGQDESMGLRIPFSIKSMLLGWGRTGTMITAFVAGLAALGEGRDHAAALRAAFICAAALAAFFTMNFWPGLRFASYERACALADLAGFDEQGRTLLELQFGRMSREEAKQKLLRSEVEELNHAERYIAARKAAIEARRLEETCP